MNIHPGTNVNHPGAEYIHLVAKCNRPGAIMHWDAWTCNDGLHQWCTCASCSNEDTCVASSVLL